MRAIRVHRFGGPEVLSLESLPDPVASHAQVVVRVHAIGVNPVDTYIREGTYGPREFPFTPGYDASGVIESVGAGVTDWKPGDRVVLYRPAAGTYAERVLSEATALFRLPASATFEQGASLGVPYLTAHVALFGRGRAQRGETVLVHGATGGVGVAAVQLAARAGLRVLGTGGTERGRELVRQQGVERVFDHTKPGCIDEIRSATGGKGPDLIIEMLANVNLENDLALLHTRGRVVIVGSRGTIQITPRHTMRGNLDVLGMSLHNCTPAEIASAFAEIAAGVEEHTVRPIVGTTLPLDQAARAHEQIMAPGAFGKIVLTCP